jgi:hypothetical protein
MKCLLSPRILSLWLSLLLMLQMNLLAPMLPSLPLLLLPCSHDCGIGLRALACFRRGNRRI